MKEKIVSVLRRDVRIFNRWRRIFGSKVDLGCANLDGADLRDADLRDADMSYASLCGADLRGADLRKSDLRMASIRGATLRGANLRGANLLGVDLHEANLSGASGAPSQPAWLADNFVYKDDGSLVVYRAQHGEYCNPKEWDFAPGNELREAVNPERGTLCGCGVSFATEQCVREAYPGQTVWECVIEPKFLAGIVVPFGTDGKARCECLKLVRTV